MGYLVLTGLLLAELMMIGAGVLLYRRFFGRPRRKQRGDGGDSHSDRLHAFLEFEIQRMQKILSELGDGDVERLVIEKRLTVFNNELAILDELRASRGKADYQALINRFYRSADLARTPEFDKLQAALAKYREHVANLEKFRTLFFRSQDDLGAAVNRVVELKRRLDAEVMTEAEQARLIELLKTEKDNLARELDIADHEIEAIMANLVNSKGAELDVELPSKVEMDAMLDQMRAIEEENDFLQVQIQYLLKAELQGDQHLQEEVLRLEGELAAAIRRHEELEKQFADLEARSPQAAS